MPRGLFDDQIDGDIRVEEEQEVKEPSLFKVIMHNDHYTTMDFVVEILIRIFHKPAAEATRLMLEIHKIGQTICGVYTYDIAVTKINQVHMISRKRGYPLRCSYEKA